MKPERLTDAELRELAVEIVQERIFAALTEDAVHNAFGMVLAFLDPAALEDADDWGLLYEEYAKASPRALNGYPIFFSFKVLHADDLAPLRGYLAEFQQTAITVKSNFVNGGGT